MRFLKNLSLAVCLFLFVIPAKAQTIKSFSNDSVKFIDELGTFFDMASKKKGRDFIEDEFKKVWLKGDFSNSRRQFVYATANELMRRKYRPYPEFENFLLALMAFNKNNLPDATFIAWQTTFKQLAAKANNKKVSNYLEGTKNLFEGNILYQSNALTWFVNKGNYTIQFDSIPKITFPSLDLICAVKADSAVIYNTQGIFYPTEEKWVGKGGKVTWVRTGIDENTVYAEIKDYNIALHSQGYTADSAVFYNKTYFPKSISGRVTDKALPDATPDNATYPKFQSYSKRFQISKIAERAVDYEGGFSMSGNKFIGIGNEQQKALLIFKRNNKKFLVVGSNGFIFKTDKIISDESNVTMYLENDSIFHPSLKVSFSFKDKLLTLIKTQDGISKTAYTNSYHKVDMSVEEISWKIDSLKMNFKTLVGSSQGVSVFESYSFFKQSRFDELQLMDELNPLTVVKDYSVKNNNIRVFSGESLAKYMRQELRDVAPLLVKLAVGGYIIYEVGPDRVTIKERLFEYIGARSKRKDYDVLTFISEVPGGNVNATMNLLNYDIKMVGVSQILLSDSQNVNIYPSKQEITLKKDRDFVFSGLVHGGLFDFYGKEFNFQYDKFKIGMANVDSMRMSVRSAPDGNGNTRIVKVKTVIENIDGELMVDEPNNKSGLKSKDFTTYPIFKSNKPSFAYYDKKNIQKGVYKRTDFYFKIDPFTIDSLDNFSPAGLKMDGDFASAGIFPQFREQLTIQPDYSLGFVRKTPTEGLALYGTKGKYKSTIKLSNKGLQGDGEIEYLTSSTQSKNIIFFPDSLNAKAETYVIKEKKAAPEYPPVKGDTVYVHWMPKKDIMQIHSLDKPIDMYAGEAFLNGRLDYKPANLIGDGRMSLSGSELDSKKMVFKNRVFDADTADFRLKSLEEAGIAFSTINVKAHVDFDKHVADFKSNGKGSIVKFDKNKYICYMDEFKWFMKDASIELSASNKTGKQKDADGLDLSGPEFISVHPNQDSLRFFAPKAKFSLKDNIIFAKQVKYINVADARIFPDSGKVTVEKEAVMRPFTKAKITANSTTKYHNLYNANVKINSRKNYVGSGSYEYIDEQKKKQPIYFAKISVDTTFQTYAESTISDSSKFMLSPNYEYRGKVKLRATDPFLTFAGACSMQHGCPNISKSWFTFSGQINPDKIYIPVSKELSDINGKPIAASIMSTIDSNQIYTAFLSKVISRNDIQISPTEGFLFFDKVTKEYRISNKEKLVERSLPGNYLSLNTNTCVANGEGKLNLGSDLGQVKVDVVGNATHNLKSDSAKFDVMLLVNFFFDKGAIEKMGEEINTSSGDATSFSRPIYEKGLRELLGKEKADKMISDVNLYGKFKKFPDELEQTLFLTDVKMRWDAKTKSYVSVGKIGVGNVSKTQVNKSIEGKIQLKRKRGGDELTIYLAPEKDTWYFFNYTNGLMQALSSKDDFNTIIKELKSEKRQMDVEKGTKPYQYNLSTATKKTLFLKKLQNADATEEE